MAIGLLTASTGYKPVVLGDLACLPVGAGLIALVDASSLPILENFTWTAKRVSAKGLFYVYGYPHGGGPEVLLHRILLGLTSSDSILGDHKNGNTLDNRLSNLRKASPNLNALNRHRRRANLTGFTGVSFHGPSGKYAARIRIQGKRTCLGYFDTPEQAAAAYTAKHKELVA